jgi:imidazolonepropionase-like amidohydrolase
MKYIIYALTLTWLNSAFGQTTFPNNGPQHTIANYYALVNATLYADYQTKIEHATLIVKEGKVIYAGGAKEIPKEAALINCNGRYIYPAFIDLYTNYGIQPLVENKKSDHETHQFVSAKKGAYNWNEAIKAEIHAANLFAVEEKKATTLREAGFGAVLTGLQDGICRGSEALVFTGNGSEHEMIILAEAAAGFSFNKGSSHQQYPSSLMGSIALLKQTYYDSKWYQVQTTETNLTLAAFQQLKALPSIFATDNKLNVLRADKLGDAFGIQYIIKGTGDEYQRMNEIKETQTTLIVPVNFPKPIDIENNFDAEYISTTDLKHWELAPYNLMLLAQKQIPFAITSHGCSDSKTFLHNIKKAVTNGLSESAALKALTETPATLIKSNTQIGALKSGMFANFIITDAPVFATESNILETWVKGQQYVVSATKNAILNGVYDITNKHLNGYTLIAKKQQSELLFIKTDTIKIAFAEGNGIISMGFQLNKNKDSLARIFGWIDSIDYTTYPATIKKISGTIRMPGSTEGSAFTATWKDSLPTIPSKKDTTNSIRLVENITYPFTDYGFLKEPTKETYLLKNATVWTNEKEGVLQQTDVLIKDGKISSIGKNISAKGAKEINATGKHITAGIIDEHSHIAISNGVNEGTQSSSSEVCVGDVINSEDINIYRQLSGGVVASQLLHGSANPIGGQSALVKLRWGSAPEKMKILGAPQFIKFALGENVKQSNWGDRNIYRYPQTRMGVEQVFYDGFIRAKEYEQKLKKEPNTRKDLELDALVEILNNKRFITCHSYVQSEINMLMHVADSMQFKVNTFTHILEGYKVADKMKAHGVHASTFADWWAYKMEVMEAIPYNAALLHKMGINTAINSDDAEMGRRLNQEAAKIVKYGGVSEEDALKMITLNPAKMLHLDDKMGSIKVGKDADIVLWSDNPLSIYTKVETTFVDGIILFSRQQDAELYLQNIQERERIIQKMVAAKRNGEKTEKKISKPLDEYHCDD